MQNRHQERPAPTDHRNAVAEGRETNARAAIAAIIALWDEPARTFWRSTRQRDRESGKTTQDLFPTVTIKSIQVLAESTTQAESWLRPETSALILNALVPTFVRYELADLRSSMDGDKDESGNPSPLNSFTLCLYLEAIASVARTAIAADLHMAAIRRLQQAVDLLLERPLEYPPHAKPHPFFLFHYVRALRGASELLTDGTQRCQSAVNLAVAQTLIDADLLLARRALRPLPPGDVVALAFCGAALACCDATAHHDYIIAALEAAFAAQDESGCWPLGRIVSPDKDTVGAQVEVSTYEMTAAVASAVRAIIRGADRMSVPPDFIEGVQRAESYISASVLRLDSAREPTLGWCSDHAFRAPMVESWTTATVLEALTVLRDLDDDVTRLARLDQYVVEWPVSPHWPSWLRWSAYAASAEVDSQRPVLRYLDRRIVTPILKSARNLPSARESTVSCLLFGPPGTGKTSIVRAVADGLGWPVLSLSPGTFIDKGLEFIEARAGAVFADLLGMSRVVVLFDECDELFRDREPDPGTEQVRNITAFVTPSMLPKLQELHDRGRCVFFICTNHLESIDPAVKRGGRIDHLVAVGPPDALARQRLIRAMFPQMDEMGQAAADELARVTERFVRTELHRAVQRLLQSGPWNSTEEARQAAQAVAKAMRLACVISEQEYAQFIKARADYCHSYQEATDG